MGEHEKCRVHSNQEEVSTLSFTPSAELSLDSAYLYVNVLEGGLLPHEALL